MLGRPLLASSTTCRSEAITSRLRLAVDVVAVTWRFLGLGREAEHHRVVGVFVFHPDQLALLVALLLPSWFALPCGDHRSATGSVGGTVSLRAEKARLVPTGRSDGGDFRGCRSSTAFLEQNLLSEVRNGRPDLGLLVIGMVRKVDLVVDHTVAWCSKAVQVHHLSIHEAERAVVDLLSVDERVVHVVSRRVELAAREKLVRRIQTIVGVVEQVDHLWVGIVRTHGVEHDLSLVLQVVRPAVAAGELLGKLHVWV